MSSSIIWLASYPKSGNTWMRVLLTNYLNPSDQPVNINQLCGEQICTDRELFNEVMGIDSSNLSLDSQASMRPAFHQRLATECVAPYFVKTHDAYSYEGLPLFPEMVTQGVIYLVRNPLDVAVSFAHHENVSVETIIERMQNKKQMLSYRSDRLYDQLPQLLNSWSGHAQSWLNESPLRTLIVRYEDMYKDPQATFRKVLEFCDFEINQQDLERAIEFSNFDLLQKQEKQQGLAMKQPTSESFFRKGRMGDWESMLTDAQIKQLTNSHGSVMRCLGYISDTGETQMD